MAITSRKAGAKTPTKTTTRRTPLTAQNPAGAPHDPAETVGTAAEPTEIDVKVSTFRVEPEPEKPKRGQVAARASFYLVPQTGELHNRPGPGWVELTPEQTAVAEVLPRRKRAAWWRQQRRKEEAADAAGR
jgi:hypothetical protein